MGRRFTLEKDHIALISVFNRERVNKDYSPRLIRWRHRLLPYEFEVVHRPGQTMGITDYLSRSPVKSENQGERNNDSPKPRAGEGNIGMSEDFSEANQICRSSKRENSEFNVRKSARLPKANKVIKMGAIMYN